jgi:sulfite reductase (NADPH) flavoprotein alpha-component
VAFSRDQEEKIYVQDRIRENAKDIKKWLESGAYFYICGDKKKMAKDVRQVLIEILGNEFLDKLENEGRYLKDIY